MFPYSQNRLVGLLFQDGDRRSTNLHTPPEPIFRVHLGHQRSSDDIVSDWRLRIGDRGVFLDEIFQQPKMRDGLPQLNQETTAVHVVHFGFVELAGVHDFGG